jgi:hypothetical protein
MKAILTLLDQNGAMRVWLRQAPVDESLKNVLKKSVKAPWVAKVEEGGRLAFLRGQIDYAGARDVGSQGVVYRFILDSENIYRACYYERGKAVVSNYRVTDEGDIVKL